MSGLVGAVWIDGQVFGARPSTASFAAATIGWRHAEMPIENDAPGGFAMVLSSALVSLGTVVFIDHHLGHGDGAGHPRPIPGGTLCSLPLRTGWWRSRRNRSLDVAATNDVTLLAALGFAEGGWNIQQQVVVLLRADAAIERLDARLLSSWLGAHLQPDLEATFRCGARIVLVAGHDGEWAEAFAQDAAALKALRDALRAACEAAHLRWAEGETLDLLRYAGHGPWPDEDRS